jgi:hypothetical protein
MAVSVTCCFCSCWEYDKGASTKLTLHNVAVTKTNIRHILTIEELRWFLLVIKCFSSLRQYKLI